MENAADALKMAAAVLIFIIAIGTSFSIFGTAKQTADSIIGMRDKQKYLEAAELDDGILYTSSTAIQGDTTGLTEAEIEAQKNEESSRITGVTKNGDRIVSVGDIISTLYRYSKEKYGVTIVKKEDGKVLARFDSTTDSVMSRYNSEDYDLSGYKEKLGKNTSTIYASPNFNELENLYQIEIKIGAGNYRTTSGAPWYGNEEQIQKRIACELSGDKYEYNGQSFDRVDGLIKKLTDTDVERIIEVTNEIDNSDYLKEDTDGDGKGDTLTNLLQQYEMPTIEIVYIVI